jgi:L-alanine-DL-glutamate epimerase-like enolase superfamily enzyme
LDNASLHTLQQPNPAVNHAEYNLHLPLRRREFFQVAAAGALGPAPSPIALVEVFPVSYPVAAHFKFLAKSRAAVFVKITCENGAFGWGQSVPVPAWSYETVESVVSTLEKHIAPILIGRDPLDIAGAHAAMNKAISPSFSTGMPIAKAGIDLALHDLAARSHGQGVAERWGRKTPARVTLSWTVNPSSLDEIDTIMEQGRSRGYRHFNVKVSPDAKFDLELCSRVRKLAPECFLWADANGGYDLTTALYVAPKLAAIGVNVFEQPVAPNRLTGLRELKKQGALPIILDEGVVSSVELIEFISLGLLDGVAMKPARTAGLWDARKQVEILLNAGLMILGSGLTDPDTALAAALQLYGAYGLKFPAALNGPQFLTGSFLRKPILVKGGEAEIPVGPGLGVEVDEQRVRKGQL